MGLYDISDRHITNRKGSNLFYAFLIMFEFIYLFVIIQKTAMSSDPELQRLITQTSFYEGISNEPTKTYLGLAKRMSHKV